jgi:hypothetical protein
VSGKTLTAAALLESNLQAARGRERAARADAARLRREMVAVDRRKEAQRLCILGRAWCAWSERDERFRPAAIRFLASYVARETDRAILAGTTWEIPLFAPSPLEGGDHG